MQGLALHVPLAFCRYLALVFNLLRAYMPCVPYKFLSPLRYSLCVSLDLSAVANTMP